MTPWQKIQIFFFIIWDFYVSYTFEPILDQKYWVDSKLWAIIIRYVFRVLLENPYKVKIFDLTTPKQSMISSQKLPICTTGPIIPENICLKDAKNHVKAYSPVWAQNLKFWDLAHGLWLNFCYWSLWLSK